MSSRRVLLIVVIAVVLTGYFIFDLGQYFSLDYLKSQQGALHAYVQSNPLWAALVFFATYVAVTALSLPGAAVMTIAAGAIFGLTWGVPMVSLASTIGATLAFWASRFVLRDWVQRRFGDKLDAVNRGIAKDGAFYLFTLRLVPLFPFFMINLLMGLTPIRSWTFFWVSMTGMLAGTVVYVNAGTQIAQIDSLAGILSPGLIGSFVLLGLFPLLAKKALAVVASRRMLRQWPRPARFDRNLIVIGAGSGGLVTAYIAAALKSRVTLIERHRMGGDCLNTGCVPSKALLRSAKFLSHVNRASEFGIRSATADFGFAEVMERVQRVIRTIEPHDSVQRYTELGVDVIQGEAKITSPYTVEVNGRTLSTRSIVIAAGARPMVPPITGLDSVAYYTSDTIWELRELPDRLVVLGGGPIGCELSQAFARLGSHVTQIDMLDRILSREDQEVSALVAERFAAEGIDVRTGTKAVEVRLQDGQKRLICDRQGEQLSIEFDEILLALGRTANTAGYGLEELNVSLSKQGTVEVNEYLQTVYPNVFAVGDVAGPYQFTHVAAHQAWYAAVNALFGNVKKFKADYSVIPWTTFTEPEVARVGLNEADATDRGIAHEITTYGIDDLDRAITDEEAHGLVKVLTVPGKDKILGVTIVGEHAGDLLAEFVLAMRHGLGLKKILGTIHTYPTLAEANKYAAGVWQKNHAPAGLLRWVERWHSWRRGPDPKGPEAAEPKIGG